MAEKGKEDEIHFQENMRNDPLATPITQLPAPPLLPKYLYSVGICVAVDLKKKKLNVSTGFTG